MISDEAPGERLKAYIRTRWTRKDGGWEALAKAANLRGRQTLNEWFSGVKEPSLHSLELVAAALGVRRVDLVAAMDGVTAPQTEEAPRPEWARGLEDRIAARLEARLIGEESIPDRVAERVAIRLGLPRLPSVEDGDEATGAPADTAGTEQSPKA